MKIRDRLKRFLKNIVGIIIWIVLDFSGLKAIWHKLFPPPKSVTDNPNYKPPVSLGIWFFTLYFALLGFSTARHERMLERAEFKYNSLTTQLGAGTSFNKDLVKDIGNIQIPSDPQVDFAWANLLTPYKSFILPVKQSLLDKKAYFTQYNNHIHRKRAGSKNDQLNDEITYKISGTKIDWYLRNKILIGTTPLVDEKKFTPKKINSSDEFLLMMTELWKAKLEGAYLLNLNLSGANLTGADLTFADLTGADLTGVDLTGAQFTSDTFFQLSKAKSLYGVQGLPKDILDKLKNEKPELLNKIKLEISKTE